MKAVLAADLNPPLPEDNVGVFNSFKIRAE
jgi:hypothetical protein